MVTNVMIKKSNSFGLFRVPKYTVELKDRSGQLVEKYDAKDLKWARAILKAVRFRSGLGPWAPSE